jgi:branched-chain amino acid transport system ATP-binding protein
VIELTCSNISLAFGGIQALTDVSLELPYGSVTAIIGPNGAGKTSLLNCISGYYRPGSGRILVGESDITNNPPHVIAAHRIARTFQHSELQLGDTVLSNIMVGSHLKMGYGVLAAALRLPKAGRSEREAHRRASELAEFVGLGHLTSRTAGELSYGHQKLVELARSLVAEPRVLLLDELTAGMNDREKERVASVLARIRAEFEITLMLIEHDVSFVRSTCDRAIALDFGNVIARGTPAEVLGDPTVIRAYLGS